MAKSLSIFVPGYKRMGNLVARTGIPTKLTIITKEGDAIITKEGDHIVTKI